MKVTEGVRRWAGRVGLVLLWVAIGIYYVFVMSAGYWTRTKWPTWTSHYDKQAEAFRAGQLALLEPPSPQLRAAREPLNPANKRIWRWDYCYYKGRLFIYWGLVPPAMLAAVKALLGIQVPVGDQFPTFFFGFWRAIVGTLLIRALARTVQPAPPRWAVWAGMLVFALANPIPYFLSRGAVYEAAIAAGSFFILCGLYFGLAAVIRAGSRASDICLAAAGLCFGLSAGSRISLLPAAGLLTAWTIVSCWQAAGGVWRRLLRPALWCGLPALALVIAQLAMNRLRFDKWFEFGVHYQMSYWYSTGPRFIIPNLVMYLFRPMIRSCEFPYFTSNWTTSHSGLPHWLPAPSDDHREPSIGVLMAVPYLWLLILAPLVRAARRFGGARFAAAPEPVSAAVAPGPFAPETRRWVIGALAISAIVTVLAPLIFANTMRYEWDFISALFMAATLASWWLLRVPQSRLGRIAVAVLVVTLTAMSIVIGILLGFTGYYDNFKNHNPALMLHLKQTFDLCSNR